MSDSRDFHLNHNSTTAIRNALLSGKNLKTVQVFNSLPGQEFQATPLEAVSCPRLRQAHPKLFTEYGTAIANLGNFPHLYDCPYHYAQRLGSRLHVERPVSPASTSRGIHTPSEVTVGPDPESLADRFAQLTGEPDELARSRQANRVSNFGNVHSVYPLGEQSRIPSARNVDQRGVRRAEPSGRPGLEFRLSDATLTFDDSFM